MWGDVAWALGSIPQVVSPRCCESDSGLRSETSPRSRGESEGAREGKERGREAAFSRMGMRGRGFVIGVTKGLRWRHTNGEGKESGLFHRDSSLSPFADARRGLYTSTRRVSMRATASAR